MFVRNSRKLLINIVLVCGLFYSSFLLLSLLSLSTTSSSASSASSPSNSTSTDTLLASLLKQTSPSSKKSNNIPKQSLKQFQSLTSASTLSSFLNPASKRTCIGHARKHLLVIIPTLPDASHQRSTLRALYTTLLHHPSVDYIFVVPSHPSLADDLTLATLGLESKQHHDIHLIPTSQPSAWIPQAPQYHLNSTALYESLASLQPLLKDPHKSGSCRSYAFVSKANPTTFVHLPRLPKVLDDLKKEYGPDNLLIARMQGSQPPRIHTGLYILSSNLVDFIATDEEPKKTQGMKTEEWGVVGWVWGSYMRHWVSFIPLNEGEVFDYVPYESPESSVTKKKNKKNNTSKSPSYLVSPNNPFAPPPPPPLPSPRLFPGIFTPRTLAIQIHPSTILAFTSAPPPHLLHPSSSSSSSANPPPLSLSQLIATPLRRLLNPTPSHPFDIPSDTLSLSLLSTLRAEEKENERKRTVWVGSERFFRLKEDGVEMDAGEVHAREVEWDAVRERHKEALRRMGRLKEEKK
ncbi:hypothetical protein HDV05_006838 [Chytridiales sp. JEL 0842]|nr:hypothetical protein HDV05_006838 [Chytridiales sp. JEL 0842]